MANHGKPVALSSHDGPLWPCLGLKPWPQGLPISRSWLWLLLALRPGGGFTVLVAATSTGNFRQRPWDLRAFHILSHPFIIFMDIHGLGVAPGFTRRACLRCAVPPNFARVTSLGESGHCYGWNSSAPGHSSSSPGDIPLGTLSDCVGCLPSVCLIGLPGEDLVFLNHNWKMLMPQERDQEKSLCLWPVEVCIWRLHHLQHLKTRNVMKSQPLHWSPVTEPCLIWIRHLPCEGWIFLQQICHATAHLLCYAFLLTGYSAANF